MIKEEKSGRRRGEKVGWRTAGRRDCYGGRTGKVGAFCPRGWAIKISIHFPRELSQPFLRPSTHLASVFSPSSYKASSTAGQRRGSTGLQRTHFVIISFNDEGSCHPSLRLLPLSAPAYTPLPPLRNIFIACPPSRWPRNSRLLRENLSSSISRSFRGERTIHRRRRIITLIPIIQILEGENEYSNERHLIKNMEESRRNKILLIKFRKSRNSARKQTLGSSICMTLKRRIRHWHILLPLLRWSAACSREKCSIPGKTIPWKGVERWEGGIGGNARRRTCYDGGNLLPRLGGSR